MKKFKRLLALVLVMNMLISILPFATYADELETFTVGEYKEEVGVPRGKGENLFTFTPTESGTYALTVYTWTGTLLSLWVSDETQTIANYYQEFDDEFCRGSCVFEAEAGKIYTFGAGGTHISEGETFPVDLRLDEAVAPTDVELSNSQITGSVGDEFDLTMRFDPLWSIPEDYTWSVDNTSVATIDADGHLTLLKGGNTTVRLTTASGMSAQCSVRVTIPTSVKFDYETKTGYVGVKDYIDYTFEPYGASDAVTITSSDPSVVEVTYEEGPDEWYMEHLAAGTATLTITTDGGLTDTCIVNVMAEMDTIELDEAVTVTVQPGDEIRFAFAVPATDEYCVYTEEEEGALGVVGEMYYNHGSMNYELTQSDEEQVFIRNDSSVARTYTLCVKKTVPVESVEIEGKTKLYVGDSVSLKAKTYPIWATYEDWIWTCSDSSAVTFDSSGWYGYVKAVAEGTAEITVTMAGGATDTVTVTVQGSSSYEEIFCGDSKTVTLENDEQIFYTFTPEEDGEYVFYEPNGEYVETGRDEYGSRGYDKEFNLSVLHEGVQIGEDVYGYGYRGISCEMKAGNTYLLCAKNSISEEIDLTWTVTIDKLTYPESIIISSWKTTIMEGSTFYLDIVLPEGTPFLLGDITWSVNDESVATLNDTYINGAALKANKPGTVTITATLENGVSASITIEVKEIDYSCGENATWSYDDATATLTISGEGAMYDKDWETYSAYPWENMGYYISNIVIEEGITHIGDSAFSSIGELRSIQIADSVTSIGSSAFPSYSWDLDGWSVVLTEYVTEIESGAFSGPVKVSVSDDNPNYSSDAAGCLYNKDQTELLHVPSILSGKFTVPDTVVTIGAYAFNYCQVTEIELSDSVKCIKGGALCNCKNLQKIEIPASVETIAETAFWGCRSLTGIWVDKENSNFTNDNCGVLFNKDMTDLIMAPGGITGSYTVPTTVTRIQYNAFTLCEKLTEVILYDGITKIEVGTFQGCIALSEITIPGSITAIDTWVFSACTSLEKIIFVGNAPAIAENALYDVTAMAYYPAGNETWTADVMLQYGGNITWVPYEVEESHTRIFGATRYDTAFKAADQLKANLGIEKFQNIVVAYGEDFADALSGSYLANQKNAPILLVKNRNKEINLVKDYIKANLTSGGTVYLLGGVNAVPKAMETGLEGFNVKRLAGATRYETNLEILKEAGISGNDILVCTGLDFADGLSASAVNKPILLVKDSLRATQVNYLKTLGTKNFYLIGGTNAVNKRIESSLGAYGTTQRIEGATRYYTSVNIAKTFFPDAKAAVLAYAQNFPDGLSGGCLACSMNAPLILTANGKQAPAVAYAKEAGITGGAVLGGTGLIPDHVANAIFRIS